MRSPLQSVPLLQLLAEMVWKRKQKVMSHSAFLKREKIGLFSKADSYGKRSQPPGSEIPLQGRRCSAFGSPAKPGLSLQWKEIGVGASVGVSVNIHRGVPTRTCPGFVTTSARLHFSFLLSDY